MKKKDWGIFQQVKLKLFELTLDEELGPSEPLRLPRPALGKIILSSISAETAPPRPPIPPELPVFPWILTNFGFTLTLFSQFIDFLKTSLNFGSSYQIQPKLSQ
jgi:hypothetical protein